MKNAVWIVCDIDPEYGFISSIIAVCDSEKLAEQKKEAWLLNNTCLGGREEPEILEEEVDTEVP